MPAQLVAVNLLQPTAALLLFLSALDWAQGNLELALLPSAAGIAVEVGGLSDSTDG